MLDSHFNLAFVKVQNEMDSDFDETRYNTTNSVYHKTLKTDLYNVTVVTLINYFCDEMNEWWNKLELLYLI